MAMTMKTEGLEEVNRIMAQLGNRAKEVARGALYDGAGVMADAITRAVDGIKTEPFRYAAGGKTRLPSPEEKEALKGKTGSARFRDTGEEVNTIVGINPRSGYADVNGKQKPVPLIARSINSGTSFMKKQPVIRRAVTQNRAAVEQAITAKAEKMFNEITKG